MKTTYLFIVALFVATFTITAQDFTYGVIGGVNFSKIDNIGSGEFTEGRIGFHLGGVAEWSFAENWAYEASLLYSQEGEAYDLEGSNVDIRLQYINIPLQFKYYAYENFSIHFGPQIGFLLKGDLSINDADPVEIEDTVNTNFAGTLGLGYDLREYNLYFKGTITYGFSDIIDNVSDGENKSQLPGSAHVSIGYKF